MQSPISNDFLKFSIDGHSEPHLIPKLLLQVSVQELHKSIVSTPEEGGLKESIGADNNIIISDSTLRILSHPNLRRCLHGTRSYVVVSSAYLRTVFIHHYYHGVIAI